MRAVCVRSRVYATNEIIEKIYLRESELKRSWTVEILGCRANKLLRNCIHEKKFFRETKLSRNEFFEERKLYKRNFRGIEPGFDIGKFSSFLVPIGKTTIFLPSDSEFPPEFLWKIALIPAEFSMNNCQDKETCNDHKLLDKHEIIIQIITAISRVTSRGFCILHNPT